MQNEIFIVDLLICSNSDIFLLKWKTLHWQHKCKTFSLIHIVTLSVGPLMQVYIYYDLALYNIFTYLSLVLYSTIIIVRLQDLYSISGG